MYAATLCREMNTNFFPILDSAIQYEPPWDRNSTQVDYCYTLVEIISYTF